ncbi:nucleotidyltransferase domain-containing protein [Archaeoglobales archaeon]|nr:MAG: nucleotidyltransferase domain-containing protein [Archaeoglobales archaeon]
MVEKEYRAKYRAKYYEVVDELSELIKKFYGEKLVSLAIFGSVARDTFRPDSDIDLLIVVENAPKSRVERVIQFEENVEEKLNRKFRELSSEGIYPVISPLIKTKDEVKLGSPVFIEMTESVKIIYDRNDFLKNYLENLKRKLDEQGAKKIIFKGSYYWLLKPDSKA